ncbi:MAG TPA: hypothetical protein VGO68_06200 [Pyrinomonadaceae bacterium]|jgi:hypothetical protein|nr:hypothetical protein [Pyrinomonadaceae bacterium]
MSLSNKKSRIVSGGQSPTIFLGDLVRAIRNLQVSDFPTQQVIAEMLGLELSAPISPLTPETPSETTAPAATPPPAKPPVIPLESQPVATPVDDSIPIALDHSRSEKGEWISDVQPLPAFQADNQRYASPPLEPLLLPQWTRGILVAALATTTDDGLPDLEKVTQILARGDAIKELPTLSSPTLRRGIQLLVDKSQAMMPFAQDQVWLQKEILKVAGNDRVPVKRFLGSPLRGAGAGRVPLPAYAPPLPGTPVVLLTDLGICQPMLTDDWADTSEWLKFSDLVRHAHCPLIAFVPYGPSRWPKKLARAMTIIQWDRRTTAATVRSVIGRGLEVPSR